MAQNAVTVTRTRLDRCATKGCPFTPEEHWDWMERCARGAQHGHRHDQPTHAHFPKKGMGGNNPDSKIVAVICWPLHDSVDNGLNGMGIALGEVRFWDVHNQTILRGPASTGEGEDSATGSREDEGRFPVLTSSSLPSPADAGEVAGQGAVFNREGLIEQRHEWTASPAAVTLSSLGITSSGGDKTSEPPLSASPPIFSPLIFRDNGIESEPEFTFDEWIEAAKRVGSENKGRQWRAGDLYNLGDDRWAEAHQYLDELGYPQETLANLANVCRAYPISDRRSLPFTFHQAVYKLPDRFQWLDRCLIEGWNRSEFRAAALGVKPKVKRYSVEELRERATDWADRGWEGAEDDLVTVSHFILWLEGGIVSEGLTRDQFRKAFDDVLEQHDTDVCRGRFSVEELRERLREWPGSRPVRNNARRWAEAWLESLDA